MNIENNWKNNWENKANSERTEPNILDRLLKYSGYDSVTGSYSSEQWKKMVNAIALRTNITNTSKVLELGCGSGAFLYVLHQITNCKIYGIDYVASHIKNAQSYLPFGNFVCAECNQIPDFGTKFDCVIVNSVAHYFPDSHYLNQVILASYKVLNQGGIVCYADVCDKDKENEYHDVRQSRSAKPEEYFLEHKKSPHLFISKPDFEEFLLSSGFKTVRFFPHQIKEYENSQFRFNVIAKKLG